ncbi:MAG TPA: hypothetical protein VME40_07910 [Caulobacteraceae bacterium]|nr:hypothetical protein [Caulobacteraceae bacterium]
MATLISVEPSGEHWSVTWDGVANAMLFKSGARAERAARSLGERLAAAGQAAEVCIRARDGAVVGRFVCARTPTAPQPGRRE